MIARVVYVDANLTDRIIPVTADFVSLLPVNAELVNKLTVSQAEEYDGAYIVDPDFVGRTLGTRNKLMRDDVTVNPIEVSEVSNLAGGKTVYIGGII